MPSTTSPMSELAELFAATGVPPAEAARVRAHLGEAAADRLRADPWLLLLVPGVRPEQADHFARGVLGGEPDAADERRCRALVTHLLTSAAREGHTATPAADVLSQLSTLRVPDAGQAVEAALDEGGAMAFDEEPGDLDAFNGSDAAQDAGEELAGGLAEAAQTLALARYGLAEEAVAEGVVRLLATAGPLLDDDLVALEELPADPREAATAAIRCGVSLLAGPGEDARRAAAPL
ncbi:MAG: helicase, RecD/TraA family, partial [Streptosporangiaceae bacterium]|nr:helicase, RecD/TraA family [Streptosporangiaceae bacterium]